MIFLHKVQEAPKIFGVIIKEKKKIKKTNIRKTPLSFKTQRGYNNHFTTQFTWLQVYKRAFKMHGQIQILRLSNVNIF